MALVDVFSGATEAEIVVTLKQLQLFLASVQRMSQQVEALLARVERVADAVGVVK